ncbi:hypothetical protein C4D60_Mb11t12830 [Musa balbisiana]|uniref:Plectin/eS10 N-terminal domain-containing protein n=1 Tax=Musa balbisiana TaxID=52838 RepID=A0A4V4H5H1_MUSBA|nr:hypothetical protein C4D60_Mb11t12830 [Musa balbisiana]
MIIPNKNRHEICKYLFQEGVLSAKKDYNLAKHSEIDVPNLQVIKLMQSFKSREYVRETFAWQHYYWYLTNDGIEYLRTFLNLPSEIVPATLKKSSRPPPTRPFGSGPPGDHPRGPPRFEGDRPRFGDRDGYRGGPRAGPPGELGDKGGAPAAFQPSFRSGINFLWARSYNLAKHSEIDVQNLQVIKLMQSFKSREYVRETFAWQHYYWYLTNDGIEYLRTFLNLPSEIVPATLKKSSRPPPTRPFGSGPPGDHPRGPPRFEGDRPRFGDRDGYRGGPRAGPPGELGDKGGAPAAFQPSFRGAGGRPGFGRGGGGYGPGAASAPFQ